MTQRRSSARVAAVFVLLLFAPPVLLSGLFVQPAHAQPQVCTTTYDPTDNVPDQQLAITSAGVYCFNAGTYDTQITVDANDVLLIGLGNDSSLVTIQPTFLTDNAPDLGSGSPSSVPAIIYVATGYTNVTVADLTVDGSLAGSAAASALPSCDSSYGCYFGILFWGASGNVTGNTLTDVDTSGYTPTPEGVGISIGTPVWTGGPCTSGCPYSSSVIISFNEVIGYAQNGIECEDGGTSCAISDNILTPQYDSRWYIASNGIEMGRGATGSIVENTISEDVYAAGGPDLFTQAQATGIFTNETVGTVVVSANTLYGDDVGIRLQGDAGTVSATSNEIDGSAFVGLAVVDEAQSVSGYTFRNEPVGIEVASNDPGSPAVVTIGCNVFSNVATPTATEAVDGGSARIDQVCLLAGPITPSSPKIDIGEAITLTANQSGGTAPYSYQWYTSPGCSASPIAGATSSTYQASPASATTYYYGANDSSSPAGSVCSAGDPVTVNPTLTAPVIAASSGAVDQDQSANLTTTTPSSGGTHPYAYQWLEEAPDADGYSAMTNATLSDYTFATSTSTTVGNWSFELQANDSAGESATSAAATVDVSAALSAGGITPASPNITSGDSITLTANPAGGVPPYAYQWYVDQGCTDPFSFATSSTFDVSPSSTTAYYYGVSDSNAATACSAGDTVTVVSFPPVPAFPFPFAIPVVLAATVAIYMAIRKTVRGGQAVPVKQRTQPRSSPR